MNWQIFPLILTALVATGSLEAIALSAEVDVDQPHATALQIAQSRPRRSSTTVTFNPPRRGAPPATVGLGSRGDCIENRGDTLAALVPTHSTNAVDESAIGLTTAAYPAFFVYVPAYATSAQALSLRLMRVTNGDQEVELYSQTFDLPPNSGVVRLRPTNPTVPPLEVGQQYHWYVSMVCNSVDQSGNALVDGWIERTELAPALSQEIERTQPFDRAILYGQAGIWHDALLTLAEMRRNAPEDQALTATWGELLQSVGLEAIANAPLIECCQPLN